VALDAGAVEEAPAEVDPVYPAHSDCWSLRAAACSAEVHLDMRHD